MNEPTDPSAGKAVAIPQRSVLRRVGPPLAGVLVLLVLTALALPGSPAFLPLLLQPAATSVPDSVASSSLPGNTMTSAPDRSPAETAATARATFGGGCFWCTEAVFQQVPGVKSVASGYSGGQTKNPTYYEICNGDTGHAECIQIEFDPAMVSYVDLLDVFFKTHDPTTLNRQGADRGTQYRSVVFHHDEQQRDVAANYIRELNAAGVYAQPVVTQLAPLDVFYPAENHHQNYYRQNSNEGYCQMVIAPKLAKFQREFGQRFRKQ